MTETVEKIATSKEEKEQETEKDPLKIRISLFYDGTLNNRDNIEEREKNSNIYKKKAKSDSNSYDNGRTNVAIMEPHLSNKKSDYSGDYDLVYKHYIPGQGTFTHDKDSVWGYAMAIGKSGVPHRAEEGIDHAVNFILNDTKNIDPTEHYIEKLTIDVFGFSRGAATARYAIHVIFDGRISGVDEYTGEVHYEWEPVFKRLNDFQYEIKKDAIEVKFAGLYGTVLSYIGSQWVGWTANTLKQKDVARAKKALHLAAADEHRKDFPLHMIKSAINKGVGEEYFLPGVHSDVGGSYNLANELELQDMTVDENKKLYMLPTSEGLEIENGYLKKPKMVIHKSHDRKRLEKDREDLIKDGWYKDNQVKITEIEWDEYGEPVEYELSVRRQGIHTAYCNIPLKIMAEYARKPDVKLIISSKLERRADIILEPEHDLKKLEKR